MTFIIFRGLKDAPGLIEFLVKFVGGCISENFRYSLRETTTNFIVRICTLFIDLYSVKWSFLIHSGKFRNYVIGSSNLNYYVHTQNS